MTDPKISCVIPTYENVGLAEQCIRAAAAQRGVAIEIVVSDDSASDAVRALTARLARDHPQILYGPGARTGNPVDNWNAGLDRARGDYAVMIHHDETLVDPDYLRRAAEALEATGARLLVSDLDVRSLSGSRFPLVVRVARLLRLPSWTLYLLNWIGPTAVVVFPLAGQPRFDRRLVWNSDVDFYARLFRRHGEIVRDSALAVTTMRHAEQITARISPRRLGLEELRLLSKAEPGRLAPWQYRLVVGFARLRLALSGG